MKHPAELPRDQLVEIVVGLVRILYGRQREDGTWTYASDKEWCGGDVCEAAATLLDQHGLTPVAEGVGEPMEPAVAPEASRRRGDLR